MMTTRSSLDTGWPPSLPPPSLLTVPTNMKSALMGSTPASLPYEVPALPSIVEFGVPPAAPSGVMGRFCKPPAVDAAIEMVLSLSTQPARPGLSGQDQTGAANEVPGWTL